MQLCAAADDHRSTLRPRSPDEKGQSRARSKRKRGRSSTPAGEADHPTDSRLNVPPSARHDGIDDHIGKIVLTLYSHSWSFDYLLMRLSLRISYSSFVVLRDFCARWSA